MSTVINFSPVEKTEPEKFTTLYIIILNIKKYAVQYVCPVFLSPLLKL